MSFHLTFSFKPKVQNDVSIDYFLFESSLNLSFFMLKFHLIQLNWCFCIKWPTIQKLLLIVRCTNLVDTPSINSMIHVRYSKGIDLWIPEPINSVFDVVIKSTRKFVYNLHAFVLW